MPTYNRIPAALLLLLTAMLACQLPGSAGSNPSAGEDSPGRLMTAAARTVEAQLTELAQTATPAPQMTRTPSPAVETGQPSATASPTESPQEPAFCGEALASRLELGEEGRILVFQVTVRTEPGLTSAQVGFLARDRLVEIVDGPRCVDGLWWWQVVSDEIGYQGWVAEADDENYFIEPL